MKITILIVPQGAVRMTQRSKWKDPDAQRYLIYKELVGWEVKPHAPREPFKGAIEVSMTFYMPIPQSWPQKKQRAHMGDNIPHTVKPDIDNLEKGLYDSLNKIFWKDDAQIYKVKDKEKYYSTNPRIEFEVEEKGEQNDHL